MTDRPSWLPQSIPVAAAAGLVKPEVAPVVYAKDGRTRRLGDWTGFDKYTRKERCERENAAWSATTHRGWEGVDGRVVVGPPANWRHWVYNLGPRGSEAYFALDQALLRIDGLAWIMGGECRGDLALFEAAAVAKAPYCPLITRRFRGRFEVRVPWVSYNSLRCVVDTAREFGATVRQESYDAIPTTQLFERVLAWSLLHMTAIGIDCRFRSIWPHRFYLAGKQNGEMYNTLDYDVCHPGRTPKMRGIYSSGVKPVKVTQTDPALLEWLRSRSPRGLMRTSRHSQATIFASRQKAVGLSHSI